MEIYCEKHLYLHVALGADIDLCIATWLSQLDHTRTSNVHVAVAVTFCQSRLTEKKKRIYERTAIYRTD